MPSAIQMMHIMMVAHAKAVNLYKSMNLPGQIGIVHTLEGKVAMTDKPEDIHARDLDDQMADARRTFDWEKQWECAIDPDTAKTIRDSRAPEHEDSCSMCGKFCAVRSMNKALNGEYIDIL